MATKKSAMSTATTTTAPIHAHFAGLAGARPRAETPWLAEAASGGVSPGGTEPPESSPGVLAGSGPGGSRSSSDLSFPRTMAPG